MSYLPRTAISQDIFVYHLKTNTTNPTNTGVNETNFLGADGKSIYFVSNRLKASYPYGNAMRKFTESLLKK
ncbi:MAG: hypothetical protein IPJ74_26690 [Saprospiraceae bacterium]|nr:hypothetical protein [Saprospiraceae bacterium]